jgi:hypothetical protein
VSFVTLAEVRPLVDAESLSDSELQAVIDREEASLAARVGALAGARTVRFYASAGDAAVLVPRATSLVAVVDGGGTVDPASLRFDERTGVLARITGYWTNPIDVTFTPTDAADVKRVLIDLVRSVVTETGYDSETMDGYSYNRGDAPARMARDRLIASLLRQWPQVTATSVRVASSFGPVPAGNVRSWYRP